jgi:hypothetical protein
VRERRGAHRILVGRPEGKRPFERPRNKWKYNIKTDLQEMGCVGRDWIDMAHDTDRCRALVNAVMNIRVP